MMRRRSNIGSMRILVSIAVSGILVGGVILWHNSQNSNQPKPVKAHSGKTAASKEEVATAANEFLIARLGEANFQSYVRAAPSSNSYSDPKDSISDFIAYHFLPVNFYSPNADNVVMIQMNRNNLDDIKTDFVPDCSKHADRCDFSVSRQEAVEIAKKHNVSGDIAVRLQRIPDATDRQLAIFADSCTQKKALYINYSTGIVLRTEKGCTPAEL